MRYSKRYLFVAVLAVPLCTNTFAQKTGLSVSLGGATFQMDDMKYLLENFLASYPVEGEIISSFPPYLSGTVTILRQFYPYLRAEAGYTLTSAGGRANYSDYTGNIETNITAISHRLGASLHYSLISSDHLDLSLYGRLDANFTSMNITSSIYVLGRSTGFNYTYHSISPNGSAGLEFLYKFRDSAIGIEGGYLVDLPGELKDKESGTVLLDPNDRQRTLNSDWTGWRMAIKWIIWLK